MKENKYANLHIALVWTFRLIVGLVFIVSGFGKAIDPWGTVYKFEDYVNILGLTTLEPFISFGAFALPVVEFLLGVFVLFGLYRRMAPLLVVALMGVMTPLTFYLAVTDRMADCGCFGDVIVLSNWSTFFKNLILLASSVYLLFYNRRVRNIYGVGVQWLVWALSMAFVLELEYLGYNYQPLIDFRPYKVGTALYDGPKADSQIEDEFVFIYSKDGVEKEFTIDSLPDEEEWEYVDRRAKTLAPIDYLPKKNGVVILDSGFDRTSELLDRDGEQLLFVFTDLSKISISVTYIINELNEFATDRGVSTFGVTSDGEEAIAYWNDISMAQYPMYFMEDTEMKILARGNPALVYVKEGKIMWKRTLDSLSAERLLRADADMMSINEDISPEKALKWIAGCYVLAMIFVLFINRVHNVVKFSIKRIKKNRKKAVPLHSETDNKS